ncbi:hypothetical protein EV702DRAFT_1148614 [Suillus placidus]|uniref:Uncharacterized protein n=1 Tax=Suillus placidus TaxID=48579 RepID=A0A9P6ZJQ8_9AGAM|nr:hypothetical protein EV702DRAFT_1148614 [Suillus placidus]
MNNNGNKLFAEIRVFTFFYVSKVPTSSAWLCKSLLFPLLCQKPLLQCAQGTDRYYPYGTHFGYKRWYIWHECHRHTSTKFAAHSPTSSNSMTIISNDPSWWPLINSHCISSYFIVAASIGVIYDFIDNPDGFSSAFIRTRGRIDLESTLVPDDYPVSHCALRWNNICWHEHPDGCSDNTADRCRVSDILG